MKGILRRKLFKGLPDDDDEFEETALVVTALMESQRRQTIHQPVPNVVKSRQRVHRTRVDADARMMQQYFNYNCVYGPKKFKGRFALPRPLFLRILEEVCDYDKDFLQKEDACGILGHSPYMKMLAVMKHFSKGLGADSMDDYAQMGASTIYHYAKKFVDAVIWIYNSRYMRQPNAQDTQRLLKENEARGFPGMLGSVDCFHWAWRACPTSQAGSHVGYRKDPTVVLQAVASYDRWIWHSYFGLGGQNNDLNVLHASGLFDRQLNNVAPPCHFQINGKNYDKGYYLGDGAYPMYGLLVKAYKPAANNRQLLFNRYQEAKRKDIERAFGGLKGKFGIIRNPCRYYAKSDMKAIMRACLIMHNMCVELEYRDEEWGMITGDEPQPPIEGNVRLPPHVLYNPARCLELRKELTTHIWERHGQGYRDGEVPEVDVDDAIPLEHEGTTGVDTDDDRYNQGDDDDGTFYENGE